MHHRCSDFRSSRCSLTIRYAASACGRVPPAGRADASCADSLSEATVRANRARDTLIRKLQVDNLEL